MPYFNVTPGNGHRLSPLDFLTACTPDELRNTHMLVHTVEFKTKMGFMIESTDTEPISLTGGVHWCQECHQMPVDADNGQTICDVCNHALFFDAFKI